MAVAPTFSCKTLPWSSRWRSENSEDKNIGRSVRLGVLRIGIESKMKPEIVPSFKLNTGCYIPGLGFGSGTQSQGIKEAVITAVEQGYRHFDTASAYGTECAIGEGLAEAFRMGLVKRDEIFVTSKLASGDYSKADVLPAIKNSLKNLQLEYLDLFLVHSPIRLEKGTTFYDLKDRFLPLNMKDTWGCLEVCLQQGLTKALGVSNFSTKKLQDLISIANIMPAVCQVEMHPIWQQRKLRNYCNEIGVHVSGWGPLGGVGKPWGSPCVLEEPVILELAQKYQRSPAQVIIRWITELGCSAIVKSYNPERITNNIKSFGFNLSKEDHDKIEKIKQKRLGVWEHLSTFSTCEYKTPEELWDGEV